MTRALHKAAPQAQIVATDVNPVMLEVAAQNLRAERVSFRPADAQDLPFEDESFDLVVCQFGVMFSRTRFARIRKRGACFVRTATTCS